MNYIDAAAEDLAALLDDCPSDLLRFYALLALVRGEGTSLEDVHDAWSAWRTATRPDHPSLIPFADLTPEVQELDRKYADAIREVARRRVAVTAGED